VPPCCSRSEVIADPSSHKPGIAGEQILLRLRRGNDGTTGVLKRYRRSSGERGSRNESRNGTFTIYARAAELDWNLSGSCGVRVLVAKRF